MQPVTLDAAAEGAKACVGMTHGIDLARSKLIKDGWGEGVGATGDLHFFVKGGIVMLIAPVKDTSRSSCVETIRLSSPTNGAAVLNAMDRAFGMKRQAAPTGQPIWFPEGEIASVSGDSATSIQGIRVIVTPNETEGNR